MGAYVGAIVEEFWFLKLTHERSHFGNHFQSRHRVAAGRKVALRRLMLSEQFLVGEIDHDIELAVTRHICAIEINGVRIAAHGHTCSMRFAGVEIDLIR